MRLNKTLHRLSKLKHLFLIAQISLIVYCFAVMPDNLISLIGIIIYLSGIQLGLESLSDVEQMSDKEIERFQDPDVLKVQSRILFIGIAVLAVISILFMSLKFVFGARPVFEELFNLGLDCWALILGFLCKLKYLSDKEAYAKSLLK